VCPLIRKHKAFVYMLYSIFCLSKSLSSARELAKPFSYFLVHSQRIKSLIVGGEDYCCSDSQLADDTQLGDSQLADNSEDSHSWEVFGYTYRKIW
jgi:hypothetical protein